MSAGLFHVIVGVALPTVRVPVPPVLMSEPSAARTVKAWFPAGVVPLDVRVSVTLGKALFPLAFQVAGENDAVMPTGKEPTILMVPLTVPFCVRCIATLNVTLPGVPKVRVPFCAPTVTAPILGASENEVWAEKP